jgi:hypothetical protein
MSCATDTEPEEDLDHPIPRLDALDVLLDSDQAVRVGIVIAAPLIDSPKSRVRLERKLELCLNYFWTEAVRQRYGSPRPEAYHLYISVHAGSDQSMLDLIQSQEDRIARHGVRPVIQLIGAN